ncbi:MAG TPA: diguanylate cyclase [Pyrinomonadaceae bacterium]|nr:diguanylate cyclase [Pyrinomonadaceae bacterium]
MARLKEVPSKFELSELADSSGLAISVIDRSGIETTALNNNSICRSLNPDGELLGKCNAFCGKALDNSLNAGREVGFTCHAGLDCRALAMSDNGKPVAVVVGRTFTKSENYRRAASLAASGEWSSMPVSAMFGNVLLTGSSVALEKIVEKLERLGREVEVEMSPIPKPEIEIERFEPETIEFAEVIEEFIEPIAVLPKDETSDWRSLYSSILSKDYRTACEMLLDYAADHYGLDSVAILAVRKEKFINVTARGQMASSGIRIGISPTDERIVAAISDGDALVLSERRSKNGDGRTLTILPVAVASDATAAIATLDHFENDERRRQLLRLVNTVAGRLEILRLRAELDGRDSIERSVKKFDSDIRNTSGDDLWQQLAANSAELLQAERASLLLMDELSGKFKVAASVGMTADGMHENDPGRRVAHTIFEKGRTALVPDAIKAGLLDNVDERGYRTRSFLSTPIMLDDRKIGVLSFTDKATSTAFNAKDLEMVEAIAPQIAVAIDREELRAKAGEFEQLSVTDALTGLLNRRYIEQRLDEEVKRSNRHGYPMSFLLLDVDHFKSYNDNFGHPAGDVALKLVANVIKDTLRGADVAARFGGEEFAILLPQTVDEEAAAIAERVRRNIEATEFPHREVTVSIGVASCSSELCSTNGLVDAADKALYDAKHRGRNGVRMFAEMEIERFE